MKPSKEDISNFLTFAPGADEGKAVAFLEARSLPLDAIIWLMRLKGANTIDEAVSQFYESPDKYSSKPAPAPAMPNPPNNTKATQASKQPPASQGYELPPYAPPAVARSQRRPHTNAVIQAGHARARDEVCSSIPSVGSTS
jgi:hypothetical protein